LLRGATVAPRLSAFIMPDVSEFLKTGGKFATNVYGKAVSDSKKALVTPVPTGPPGDSVRAQPLPIISVVTVLSPPLAT
jgi:hypothetical protein